MLELTLLISEGYWVLETVKVHLTLFFQIYFKLFSVCELPQLKEGCSMPYLLSYHSWLLVHFNS